MVLIWISMITKTFLEFTQLIMSTFLLNRAIKGILTFRIASNKICPLIRNNALVPSLSLRLTFASAGILVHGDKLIFLLRASQWISLTCLICIVRKRKWNQSCTPAWLLMNFHRVKSVKIMNEQIPKEEKFCLPFRCLRFHCTIAILVPILVWIKV